MIQALAYRAFAHFMWLFSRFYGTFLCWRYLDGVHIRGLEEARALAARSPVILACTHHSWWDGILVLKLPHWLGTRGRFFVDATSADSMTFIPILGGIGLKRDSMSAMVAAMEQGSEWLEEPAHSVIIFPQGRFRPMQVRPLGLQRGVRLLQRLSDAPIIPVSITMSFLDTHLPSCLITLGEPIEAGRRDVMEVLEERMASGLDEHVAWLDEEPRREGMFETVVPSGIVPIERRPAALFYNSAAAVISTVITTVRALGGRQGSTSSDP